MGATFLLTGAALTQTQPAAGADRYIVVLDDVVDNPSQVASGLEQRQDLDVGFVYSSALEGFSAEIPDENVAALRADPRVDYVERDTPVHTVAQKLPWGVDKIGADESSTRAGNGSGRVLGVNVYILDTGVYRGPTDLRKNIRDLAVANHINFYGGEDRDCGESHGTHVAGVVAAKDNAIAVVGVAPGAPLTSVKVVDCMSGSGPVSTVIEGIDWVTANAIKPAVANLSLSGAANQALDDAVRRSANSGVFYSVAAGNEGDRACAYSPAAAGRTWDGVNRRWVYNNGIATTAAVRFDRKETGWSNFGDCVDLWAPGKDILSTKSGGGVSMMSGTSMAAPHVGAAAALYLSKNTGATPSTVEGILKDDAVRVASEKKRSKDGTRINFVHAGEY